MNVATTHTLPPSAPNDETAAVTTPTSGAPPGTLSDLTDVFFGSSGSPWDFNAEMIPPDFFEGVNFYDEAVSASSMSPKALRTDSGMYRQQPSQPAQMQPTAIPNQGVNRSNSNVTRLSSGGTAGKRGPKGSYSAVKGPSVQNWFGLCQKPAPLQSQQMAGMYPGSSGMAYAAGSPFLAHGGEWVQPGMISGGSPNLSTVAGVADPYAWMHSGRPKRPFGHSTMAITSPPMFYHPSGHPISPPFGPFMNQVPMIMVPQPIPKLPVQPLPPRAEASPAEATLNPAMAPLILPTDLGKPFGSNAAASAKTQPPFLTATTEPDEPFQIDPNAITSAISNALRMSTSTGGEEAGNISLPITGIPLASQVENMTLYENTFAAFIKEEEAIDYNNVTVIDLKKLLRKYHLAAAGKKNDLIKLVKEIAQFLRGNPPKPQNPQPPAGLPTEAQQHPSPSALHSQEALETVLEQEAGSLQRHLANKVDEKDLLKYFEIG